jgi:DNA polymerase-1
LQKSDFCATLLLQVHDELIIEVARKEAKQVGEKAIELMANAHDIGVPLDVDYGISKTWYEGH